MPLNNKQRLECPIAHFVIFEISWHALNVTFCEITEEGVISGVKRKSEKET